MADQEASRLRTLPGGGYWPPPPPAGPSPRPGAHLSNFGAFASPARRLVFDVNDFDETLPGPFEWDVKRLAASLVVAGRDNGFSKKDCRKIALAGTEAYRTVMRRFAGQHFLDVWYAHLDIEDEIAEMRSQVKRRGSR